MLQVVRSRMFCFGGISRAYGIYLLYNYIILYIYINIIRLSSSWDVHDVIIDLDHLGSWGSCWVEHNHGHRTMGLGDAHPLTGTTHFAWGDMMRQPQQLDPTLKTMGCQAWYWRVARWFGLSRVGCGWVLTSGGVGNLYIYDLSCFFWIA